MTDMQRMKIEDLRLAGYGYLKIAKEIGVSENTVKSYCRRSKTICEEPGSISVCEQCGKTIDKSSRSAKRFCADVCRSRWWNEHQNAEKPYSTHCAYCGKKIHMRRRNEKKYCSHACYIKARYGGGGSYE